MNNSTHFYNKKSAHDFTQNSGKNVFEDPDFNKSVLIEYLNVSTNNKSPMMFYGIFKPMQQRFCLILSVSVLALREERERWQHWSSASFSKSSRVLNSHSRVVFNDGM